MFNSRPLPLIFVPISVQVIIINALVIQLANTARTCLKYTSYQCSIKLRTVYLISHLGSPTHKHTYNNNNNNPWYSTVIHSHRAQISYFHDKHGDSREVTWADLKTQEIASCTGKKAWMSNCCTFYSKPAPSLLKTFLRTGNVLLHSVTPLSLYIFIYSTSFINEYEAQFEDIAIFVTLFLTNCRWDCELFTDGGVSAVKNETSVISP